MQRHRAPRNARHLYAINIYNVDGFERLQTAKRGLRKEKPPGLPLRGARGRCLLWCLLRLKKLWGDGSDGRGGRGEPHIERRLLAVSLVLAHGLDL